jgi:hypothetical protein
MIGLLIGPSAAPTVAGVRPLSRPHVAAIKAREWLRGSWLMLAILAVPLAFVAIGVVCGFVVNDGWVNGIFGSLFALVGVRLFVGMLRAILAHPPHWATAAVGFEPMGRDYCFYDDGRRQHALPEPVQAIVGRLYAAGLTPQVEYFDDDPFLFVELRGRRVYLAHWA